MKRNVLAVVLPALIVGLGSLPAQATFYTNYPTGDSRMYFSNTNWSEGASGYLSVYDDGAGNSQRTVVQFDLSGLPGGLSVASATLTLYPRWAGTSQTGNPVEVYRVTSSWTEGGGPPDYTLTGVNWAYRDAGTSNPWTTPGVDNAGTTGLPLASPYASDSTFPGYDVPQNFDVTLLAQQWYGGTYPDYGFMLRPNGTSGLHWYSREEGGTSLGPKLVIELIPEPASFGLLALAAFGARFWLRRKS